jgi:hypothetical protein
MISRSSDFAEGSAWRNGDIVRNLAGLAYAGTSRAFSTVISVTSFVVGSS